MLSLSRRRGVAAASVAILASAGCQLVGGIDSRSLGTFEDAGADSTTAGDDSAAGDAGADASDADATGPLFDAGGCETGSTRCNGLQPQSCAAGQWADAGPPCPYVCFMGACSGTCTPTSLGCAGLQPQSCDDAGQWVEAGAPCPQLCNAGTCSACAPGSKQCNALQPEACDDAGLWEPAGSPCTYVCAGSGTCMGTCTPGAVQCSGYQPQVCDAGTWANSGSVCPYGCSSGGCVVTYVGEVMADDPIAYWRLDEPAGSTTAVDFTGHGNDGTYYGEVLFAQPGAIQGDPDTCVELNGTGDMTGYVGLSDSLSTPLEFNGQGGLAPFSLEAWIQPTSVTTEYRGVLSNEVDGTSGKEGYVIYVGGFTSNGTGIGFERYQNGASSVLQDAGAVTQNSGWYHVVGTYDGSTMRLYVNGQQVATGASSLQIQSFTCTFNIGATHCGETGTNFQGYVDEVAVYGTALPQARIQAHYQAATQ